MLDTMRTRVFADGAALQEILRYAEDPHWRELALFYEYFHGDTGRGVGAAHQTGWTALAASLLENVARAELHARGHGAHRAARVRPEAAGVR